MADSILFESKEIDGELQLFERQRFRGSGAHGWEHFQAGRDHYIAVPYYYGNSNPIYWWEERSSTFNVVQNLEVDGPAQTEAYDIDGTTYLAIGENFANSLGIYELIPPTKEKGAHFVAREQLHTPGAGAMAFLSHSHNGLTSYFLASTSYWNSGWNTESPIFRWNAAQHKWKEMQRIPTRGAHDAEAFTLADGRSFFFFSNDRDPSSSKTASELFVFDELADRFKPYQKLPTDGAHAAEFFIAEGHSWLAVANFGDRLGKRYKAKSSIFVWDEAEEKFILHQEVDTFGATDIEHFQIGGTHYLAIANEGDLGRVRQGHRQWRDSEFYRMDTTACKEGHVDL